MEKNLNILLQEATEHIATYLNNILPLLRNEKEIT